MVNDIHSRLNPTSVQSIHSPSSLEELCSIVRLAASEENSIAIAGGRHAMGGQQFATSALLIDTRSLNRVLHFDQSSGIVEAEGGIFWPELIEELSRKQVGVAEPWGVLQTQTGASRLSLGGALSANIHGRGLQLSPFVQDVESFVIVMADGKPLRCSRREHSELFYLVIGGYGLFGIIYSVQLRLKQRQILRRVVELAPLQGIIKRFEDRIVNGFLYGDWQFTVDEKSDDFLQRGVFSCYHPLPLETSIPNNQQELSEDNWMELLYLAHTDRAKGFQRYADYYLSTTGQVYWSDLHQLGTYLDDYHRTLDEMLGAEHPGSEIITEIYVPRERLEDFLCEVAEDFRHNNVVLIYGTVRLIEAEEETFLRWATENYACVIFNLHTEHSPEGIEHSAEAFQRLIDMAIIRGGSYYLTYHRFARKDQVVTCYPQFEEFLLLKRKYDPEERFQSDWYRHYRTIFSGVIE
ncbi:MAG: FAD-binding oxidoreductase [Ignavibacteriae bacterium]|nr:FAD-binding oxidoreductase [Ignavibacteriota bacterium]MCB9215973.1 FAD-binding oxidoreductase [Ignavibacteria bacterium]